MNQAAAFTFVPFGGTAAPASVCCDGLVDGAGRQLSHWEGNRTPAELKADTSVEIALASVRQGGPPGPAQRVVNNHFDTDGVLAVFVLLEPELAQEHATLLVAAAEAGDFEEWPALEAGLRLESAVRRLARGAGGDAAAYARVLPALPQLLRQLESREDLWGDDWRALEAARAHVESGGALQVSHHGGLTVLRHARGVSELPGPLLHRRAGPGARRWLLAFEEEGGGGFQYRYERPRHAWADTVVRPALPRPRRRDLHRALGAVWSLKGELGMTGLARTTAPVNMPPEEVVALCQRHDSGLT